MIFSRLRAQFIPLLAIFLFLTLTACGGSGGGEENCDPDQPSAGAGFGGCESTTDATTGGDGDPDPTTDPDPGSGEVPGAEGEQATGIVSAISFISATPTVIGIKGSGRRPDTSLLVFEVTDTAGFPVPDMQVVFNLDTAVGGIALEPSSATTDAAGRVQTIVRAGTVHTSVRVTASLLDNAATALDEGTIPPALSDSLVISTGIADQDSFSLSIGCFNIEGDTLDNIKTNVNLHAADRFNNPVPDGTAIAFTAEGGSVQSQCFTLDGGCTVDFKTQNPRTPDHRVTILATAVGEESFIDLNGDGRYQATEPFVDLAEAFRDDDENGVRDPASEIFLDFDSSGTFSPKSGNFSGVLCDSGCDTKSSAHVRDSQIIIMSGSTAFMNFSPTSVDLSNGAVAVTVLIGDDANQPMPGGSTISAETSVGSIVGDSTFTQACTTFNGRIPYTFVIDPPSETEVKNGTFSVKVVTPTGVTTTASIGVFFTPNPAPPPPPPAPLGSIQFISASPTTIGIKGTGIPEVSEVAFQVRNTNGALLPNQPVTFSLSTSVGGITFSPVSATSDASGNVVTRVNSGTVHTSVRVSATATQGGTTVTAVSSALAITTGLPDQDSVSLSFSKLNAEGLDFDETPVTVSILAADRFNNPVPDGTTFTFTTSGGLIDGDCQTLVGKCSVTWRSSNPRPAGNPGRAVILASAIGEESFTDLNGNGRFDDGEPQTTDIGEAFRDDNENSAHDAAAEEFLDFNNNTVRDGPSGNFTGVLCDGPTQCDASSTKLHVFANGTIVMSGSTAVVDQTTPSGAADVTLLGNAVYRVESGVPTIVIRTDPDGGSTRLQLVIRDVNDQPMPEGTTLTLSNLGGEITITPTATFTVSNSSNASVAANTYQWTLTDEVYVAGDQIGTISLLIKTPKGVETAVEFGLRLDDAPFNPPPQCSDGADNEPDGLTDFPADPQCDSAKDDDESA